MQMYRIIPCCLLLLLLASLSQAKIVFKSKRDGSQSLYVMDDDGRNVKKVTIKIKSNSVFWPVWSHDGKQIAFAASPPGAPDWPQRFSIYIINNDGSNLYRLTNEDTMDFAPSWSPDGQHIIYGSDRSGEVQIWKMNLITKDLQQLTRTKALSTTPAWSPNGRYIAYGEYSTIYVMLANGTKRRSLIPSSALHSRNFPRWSPDSKSVVYTEATHSQVGEGNVSDKPVIHDIESGKRKIVDTPDSWKLNSACFADDGKQLLISAAHLDRIEKTVGRYDIYKYHLVSGESVKLTDSPENDFAMDWISDDVLSVVPTGKKTLTWSELKK